MGVFYDPLKKKTQSWVFVVFIIVPVLLIVVGFIIGKSFSHKNAADNKDESPQEFFQKFPTK